MKYLLGDRIEELIGSQSIARQCFVSTILHRPAAESSTLTEGGLWQLKPLVLSVKGPDEEIKCKDLERFMVGDDLEKFFQVGAQLPPQEKEELVEFLRKNVDIFTWNAYEALGVDPNFICHHLNINPSIIPKKQPPWCSS